MCKTHSISTIFNNIHKYYLHKFIIINKKITIDIFNNKCG